ncbi:L-rhamnose mutarotase [Sphingobacterium sp. BIGb0165]|uniref:L-rhamnose mutarotase n=1 Tax=Sphingobacterium sp. BIGb0165 TaxID=2940615 RepID=UPI0021693C8D|nr:L-rhamnose mutarotase [Sphingobacterium sp. BIGb0165]MCS4226156.1 L-rhamnose mutarotase [Sphingobacterium sp. BIGb0165]
MILKKLVPFVLFTLVCAISILMVCCGQDQEPDSVRRYASITGVKAEKLEYYKKLHADAWPTVLRKIKECHIQNYSIFLKEVDGRHYLFSYFEYTGTDFNADMHRMAADPETQRWWKETDPCQMPLPDARAKGAVWSDMEEIFHTN